MVGVAIGIDQAESLHVKSNTAMKSVDRLHHHQRQRHHGAESPHGSQIKPVVDGSPLALSLRLVAVLVLATAPAGTAVVGRWRPLPARGCFRSEEAHV